MPQFKQLLESLDPTPGHCRRLGHRRDLYPEHSIYYPEHSIYNRVLDLDWIYPAGNTNFWSGDVLIRRTALAEVEGYDSHHCRRRIGDLPPFARTGLQYRAYRRPDDPARS